MDSIVEGVGLNRLTANFKRALPLLDGATAASDADAVRMAAHVRTHDGLFIGSSSAVNLVGAVRVARALGPGHVVATLICDSGARHVSRFYDPAALAAAGLGEAAGAGVGGATDLRFLDG